MTQIMTQVAEFFTGLVGVLMGLLIPATGTTIGPLQVVMWAGLTLGFLVFVVNLVKKLAA